MRESTIRLTINVQTNQLTWLRRPGVGVGSSSLLDKYSRGMLRLEVPMPYSVRKVVFLSTSPLITSTLRWSAERIYSEMFGLGLPTIMWMGRPVLEASLIR